ncbi:hypothetical protein MGYG_09050 [Nannizzia gypsea CBS 118893]|uniref:Uncharacterized protein n=1 Tax=Arthroderma gypseum (strain ATCC MYA-4604 / CBS 118893) TaxID=535722 RepID=E4UTH8_ARTGP|nr:hypothetical protein MGYG_09050 [Nannizzia gypsea CBS 118893]EFR01523.1 hypothetical protein MGYG_09050 [Nannizzia gypsea CBS 118893]
MGKCRNDRHDSNSSEQTKNTNQSQKCEMQKKSFLFRVFNAYMRTPSKAAKKWDLMGSNVQNQHSDSHKQLVQHRVYLFPRASLKIKHAEMRFVTSWASPQTARLALGKVAELEISQLTTE